MNERRRGLLTTGCHQTFWSADNRLSLAKCLVLSPAKSLLKTSCIFPILLCTLFNNIRHSMIYSVVHCFYLFSYIIYVRTRFFLHDLYMSNDEVSITQDFHFHCESLNVPLHLRCGSYLHEQIDFSHTHIRAI